MIFLRTPDEKPWISRAGGIPVDRDFDMTHEPLRSRRLLFAARGLDLGGDILDGILDSRDAEDFTEGVEGGESSNWAKSGSSGRATARVLYIIVAVGFPSVFSKFILAELFTYKRGHRRVARSGSGFVTSRRRSLAALPDGGDP